MTEQEKARVAREVAFEAWRMAAAEERAAAEKCETAADTFQAMRRAHEAAARDTTFLKEKGGEGK